MSFGSPLLRYFSQSTGPAPIAATVDPMLEDPVNSTTSVLDNESSGHASDDDWVDISQLPTEFNKRSLQCVSTKAQRVKVLSWMESTVDARGAKNTIISEAVRQFPSIFRGRYGANVQKCSRWWKSRDSLRADFIHDHLSVSHTYVGNRKRVELKARPGRGRKQAEWVKWLYPQIREEFDRLRKSGVKFSPALLRLVAKSILLKSTHPTFKSSYITGPRGLTLNDMITTRWTQQFQESQGIVHRTQTGKLSLSPAKMEFIDKEVAYHMGELQRGFASGQLNEDLIENMDETHFIINMDNKRTLGVRGDKEVRYSDMVSGGHGMTMVVKITGGRGGKIGMPMMIFLNKAGSHPIRGHPDTVLGVTYRSAPRAFMTSRLLTEYYSEPKVSWADPAGRRKVQYIDNYPGHNILPSTIAALERINTTVKTFPTNSTHLVQPADSFVISKIKQSWCKKFDAKKFDMIQKGQWQGHGESQEGCSGALKNPGWTYFLKLGAEVVKDVNAQVDNKYGINYARKAMIRTGMSLNLQGQWKIKQLTPQLQEIIRKYRRNFQGHRDGLPPLADGSIVAPDAEFSSVESLDTADADYHIQETEASPSETLATVTTVNQTESPAISVVHEAGQSAQRMETRSLAIEDSDMVESVDQDALSALEEEAGFWQFVDSQYNA